MSFNILEHVELDRISQMKTYCEITYYQEPYKASFDYRSLLNIDVSAVEHDKWSFGPVQSADEYWDAYRVRNAHVQALKLFAHGPQEGFRLSIDDPIVELFQKLMIIDPLDSIPDSVDVELCLGISDIAANQIYMRFLGPEVPIAPLVDSSDYHEMLLPAGLGLEERLLFRGDPGRAWWVSYVTKITQEELQAAYTRLVKLHSWLTEYAKDAGELAERSLRAWLNTLQ